MRKLGKKQLTLQLSRLWNGCPQSSRAMVSAAGGGRSSLNTYDTQAEHSDIPALLREVNAAGIELKDLHTTQSSLEDIFVDLVREAR